MSRLPKMTRQLLIFDRIRSVPRAKYASFGTIIGPTELMTSFNISLRTLQRDLEEFRDSGLLNVTYDKPRDRYLKSDKRPVFDENAGERRKQHLRRLYRLGTLIDCLPSVNLSDLEDYEAQVYEYNEMAEWSREDPEEFPPEDLEAKYDELMANKPKFPDLKEEYYLLFPDSNERTRQRDFKALRNAGFDINYNSEYKTVIYLIDDVYAEY